MENRKRIVQKLEIVGAAVEETVFEQMRFKQGGRRIEELCESSSSKWLDVFERFQGIDPGQQGWFFTALIAVASFLPPWRFRPRSRLRF